MLCGVNSCLVRLQQEIGVTQRHITRGDHRHIATLGDPQPSLIIGLQIELAASLRCEDSRDIEPLTCICVIVGGSTASIRNPSKRSSNPCTLKSNDSLNPLSGEPSRMKD